MPPRPSQLTASRAQKDDSIETIEGYQGAMTEIAINGGDGLKKPHPALLDPKVREAIGHAIDRETLVNRVESGFAQPLQTLSTSPDPKWTPDLGDGRDSRVRPRQGERDSRRSGL